MAKRRIKQETFDSVVRENIEEFDMEESEALKEAIEQFESQGNFTSLCFQTSLNDDLWFVCFCCCNASFFL